MLWRVRAKAASNIATSRYTSVKFRNQQLLKNPERANQPLMPLVGVRSFNLPDISAADYIELVDFTGRELHSWDWLCTNFEQDLGRYWITFYAAIAAKGVGF